MGDWTVVLDDSVMCGGVCDGTEDAFLTLPPDGLGAPDLTTNDQAYPQRDGVDHFGDWYGPRIVTMTGVIGSSTCTDCDGDPRQHAAHLVKAWERRCDDVELVIHVPCEGQVSPPENVLQNPSFTLNTDHWHSLPDTQLFRATDVYDTAPASARVVNVGIDITPGLVSDTFPIQAGRRYTMSGKIRSSGYTRLYRLIANWYDDEGTDLGTEYGDVVGVQPNEQWFTITVNATAPAGATNAAILAYGSIGVDGEYFYYDSFSVTESGDNSNLIPNPSFDIDLNGWNFSPDNIAVRNAFVFQSAPASAQVTAGEANIYLGVFSPDARVYPGHRYNLLGYVRAAETPRSFTMQAVWYDSANNLLSTSAGPVVSDSTSAWTAYAMNAVEAPPGAAFLNIYIQSSSTVSLGDVHYFDTFSALDLTPAGDEVYGPFGVRGRPRVAQLTWRKGRKNVADVIARFDGNDQRLFILDGTGAPGSGGLCSTLSGPPSSNLAFYEATVSGFNMTMLWPLDFPRTGPWDPSVAGGSLDMHDIIGTDQVAASWAGGFAGGTKSPPATAPPLSYKIGLSSISGPATVQSPALPSSYTEGVVGWWQETPSGKLPSGAMLVMGAYRVGADDFGQPSPEIRWNGTNVAMNDDTQDAFGFTTALRDEPVLIVLTWTSSTLKIYAGHKSNAVAGTKLIQTVSVGSKPISEAASLQVLGRANAMMMGTGTSIDGEDMTDDLTRFVLTESVYADGSGLTIPDLGTVCAPIQASFTIESGGVWETIYILREDGSYVGVAPDGPYGGNNASSLDTETGTALRFFDQTDATAQIVGDPFLTVTPGETLHIFGGPGPDGNPRTVQICYRPAVLSA